MRTSIMLIIAALVSSGICAIAPQKARAQPPIDEKQGVVAKAQLPDKPKKVVVTCPRLTDAVITQLFPASIRARRQVEIRAAMDGHLESILVQEGQAVKRGDVLFQFAQGTYKARLDVELAEVQIAELEFAGIKKQFDKKAVSEDELKLSEAKLARARAKAKLAEAELNTTTIKAPFDGLLDWFFTRDGSLVKQGETLTTLSDNSVMRVYFRVPESRYLKYMAQQKRKDQNSSRLELADSRIELTLADGSTIKHDAASAVTIEGSCNAETGTISFRADFPNPKRLLRHGQTGVISIRQTVKNAIVIPQQATFEILDRRYVYVVGKDDVVHQREITVEHEADDDFVIKGLDVNDRIVFEGINRLRDGEKVECEFCKPEDAVSDPKKDRGN